MAPALRVLLAEDSEDDALLTLREVRNAGFDPIHKRVESAEDYSTALVEEDWDIVLSDYAMPFFSGGDALRILKETGRDIPFILVSGAVGEQVAVDMMRAGAHDYVLKDNLRRLGPAVVRELREKESRGARHEADRRLRESEQRYRTIFDTAAELIISVDREGILVDCNDRIGDTLGYRKDEVLGKPVTMLIEPGQRTGAQQAVSAILSKGFLLAHEHRMVRKDGSVIDVLMNSTALKDK
ncbi:MAG: PAS domain S-box protein, partial [Chitinivibrionales bacterium]|nr:PAS domain S-box protein [Chitinivibrionales bacterium]